MKQFANIYIYIQKEWTIDNDQIPIDISYFRHSNPLSNVYFGQQSFLLGGAVIEVHALYISTCNFSENGPGELMLGWMVVNGLMHEESNSAANALELCLSSINPLIYC